MTTHNTSNREIVKLTEKHLATLIEIFRHGQLFHHNTFPEIFCEPQKDTAIADHFMQFMDSKGAFSKILNLKNPFRKNSNYALGLEENGKLCGYLLYSHYRSSNVLNGFNKWTSMIYDIAVAPDYRRNGSATLLLEAFLKKVEHPDGCTIYANIWNGNSASEDFFTQVGFTQVSKQFHLLKK